MFVRGKIDWYLTNRKRTFVDMAETNRRHRRVRDGTQTHPKVGAHRRSSYITFLWRAKVSRTARIRPGGGQWAFVDVTPWDCCYHKLITAVVNKTKTMVSGKMVIIKHSGNYHRSILRLVPPEVAVNRTFGRAPRDARLAHRPGGVRGSTNRQWKFY